MSETASALPIFVERTFPSPLHGHRVRGAVSSRPPARASVRIPRRARRVTPRSAVAGRANRSAARPDARAFRGINGRLPAVASPQSPRFTQRRRAPSIHSTVPLHPRFIAALSVSLGDRRMRGRKQLDSTAHPTPRLQQPSNTNCRLPRKLGQRVGPTAHQVVMGSGAGSSHLETRRSVYELLPCEFNAALFCSLMTLRNVEQAGIGRRG
jgi:hypothetical protein